MEMESLRDLYIEELKDLYSAEKQLVRALQKMAKHATNAKLSDAFTNHLAETEGHVQRLETIFESLESSPRGKKCVGMAGLIEEANELIEDDPEQEVVDAGLISKAQHVEHYEIAGYGTVRNWARQLGETRHAELLEQTLEEEKNADALLTQLAEAAVNVAAMAGETMDERGDSGSTSRSSLRSSSRAKSRGGMHSKTQRRSRSSRTSRASSR